MGRRTTNGVIGSITSQLILSTNTITTTVVNSDLSLIPNGTGKVVTANAVNIDSVDVSTTPSTGALVIAGGAGIGGAITVAGVISTTLTTPSTSTITGSIVAAGGLGVAGQINANVINSVTTVSGAVIRAQSTAPYIELTDTNGSVDEKNWRLGANGGVYQIDLMNDAGSAIVTTLLTVGPTGDTVISGKLTVASGTSGIIGWGIITGTQTLPDTDGQFLINPTSAYTVTLPNTVTNGRVIKIGDGGDDTLNFATRNITIARGTRTINGAADNFILNVRGALIELVYLSGDWKVFAQAQ
jgi:hypothetical protein